MLTVLGARPHNGMCPHACLAASADVAEAEAEWNHVFFVSYQSPVALKFCLRV